MSRRGGVPLFPSKDDIYAIWRDCELACDEAARAQGFLMRLDERESDEERGKYCYRCVAVPNCTFHLKFNRKRRNGLENVHFTSSYPTHSHQITPPIRSAVASSSTKAASRPTPFPPSTSTSLSIPSPTRLPFKVCDFIEDEDPEAIMARIPEFRKVPTTNQEFEREWLCQVSKCSGAFKIKRRAYTPEPGDDGTVYTHWLVTAKGECDHSQVPSAPPISVDSAGSPYTKTSTSPVSKKRKATSPPPTIPTYHRTTESQALQNARLFLQGLQKPELMDYAQKMVDEGFEDVDSLLPLSNKYLYRFFNERVGVKALLTHLIYVHLRDHHGYQY